MGIRLQRHLGKQEDLIPGQFCVDHLRHKPGTHCLISICCPECGGIDELSADHKVERDGRVVPAWSCPTATCGLIEFVHLESWGVLT